jgi:hypothetical protein
MNAGPVEESGDVAKSLISSLKDSPLTLALVLFNLVFLAAIYFGTQQERQSRDAMIKLMADNNLKTADMLYHCRPYSERPEQQHWKTEERWPGLPVPIDAEKP